MYVLIQYICYEGVKCQSLEIQCKTGLSPLRATVYFQLFSFNCLYCSAVGVNYCFLRDSSSCTEFSHELQIYLAPK
jgi:hypothetical protein